MSGENKKSIDSAVLAAIITVSGGIIVALITTFANRPTPLQPTPIPPTAVVYTETVAPTVIPTDTVPAGDPSSTPEPPTETPTIAPTATFLPAGVDWSQNCISTLWMPVPASIAVSSDDKGCLIQPVDKFYTTGGKLGFSFSDKVNSAQIYGLISQLPSDGTASLNFHLSQVNKGDILIGIFAEPDVNSSGVILVIPAGKSLDEQRMLLKRMPGQKFFAESNNPVTSSSATYDATFDFNSGSVNVKVRNKQINLGTVQVVSANKWLFVGYQAVTGTNSLQAEFYDLVVQKR
jgi:hypothetical protein